MLTDIIIEIKTGKQGTTEFQNTYIIQVTKKGKVSNFNKKKKG
jgi:hypothetical protein